MHECVSYYNRYRYNTIDTIDTMTVGIGINSQVTSTCDLYVQSTGLGATGTPTRVHNCTKGSQRETLYLRQKRSRNAPETLGILRNA